MQGISGGFYSLCNPIRFFFVFFIFTLVFGKAAKKLLVTFLKKISKASFALSTDFMEVVFGL